MRQDSFAQPLVAAARDRAINGALKVPFGLKDGRMWSPKQVMPGLACGCMCPACHSPLIAKATESQRRRPHFAHLAESNCRAGYETALHKKAKQLLVDQLALLLPGWDGEDDMPNPPFMLDERGQQLFGRRIEFPAKRVQLSTALLEESRGDYTPDVIATDEQGELLIEIRVTHAVDPLKRRRIQSEGGRLIEIDLSKLDPEQVHDEAWLSHQVLDETSNRYWLSCPAATEAWRESCRELKLALADRNREIARERQRNEEAMQAEQRLRDQAAAAEVEKRANRERFRDQERSRYRDALEDLSSLVAVDRIQELLAEYRGRDMEEAERLTAAIPSPSIQGVVRSSGPNSWLYQAHPQLWQAASYHHFVLKRSHGNQFNQRDVARWVMQQFGKEETLYKLFIAQYSARNKARMAGYSKHRISHWAFTELENRQIPNFYTPINTFVDRLVYVGSMVTVPDVLGEVLIR